MDKLAKTNPQTPQEAIEDFSKKVLRYADFKAAYGQIEKACLITRSTKSQQIVTIGGAPGTGLTTLVHNARTRLQIPEPFEEEGQGIIERKMPFIEVELPATATEKSIILSILSAIGSRDMSGANATLKNRLMQRLKVLEPQMVVFDRSHHLAMSGTDKQRERYVSLILEIFSRIPATLVFLGYQGGLAEVLNNSILRNLSRFQGVLNSFPYVIEGGSFGSFVDGLHRVIERLEVFECRLDSRDTLYLGRLYMATGGNQKAIKDLYRAALMECAHDGNTVLDINVMETIQQGMSIHTALHGSNLNPFRMTREQVKNRLKNKGVR